MSESNTNRPKVDVLTWPGIAICSALQMVLSVDELPGIGEDFEALGRVIAPPLADSIRILLLANIPAVLTELGLLQGVSDLSPEEFLEWVESLDAAKIADLSCNWDSEKTNERHETLQSPQSSQAESPAEWLHAEATEAQLEQVRRLQEDPASLKSLTTELLRTFWNDHFRAIYVRHSDAMSRAVEQLRHHEQLDDLLPLLERLLGRSIQLTQNWINHHDRILLVPFPFMGPYLMSMSTEEPEPMLLFAFDAERAIGLQATGGMGPDISKLKALADETRLKILRFVSASERFGGDIVTHLGISQPGVSRHLRLLKASGLLSVRQEGTSKFYSICNAELDALADGIRQMRSDAKEDEKGGKQ